MDTTEFSDDLGVYEHGAEDLAGVSSQSPVTPIYENEQSHAKEQAQKDPPTSGDSFSWAYLHEWRFATGESPMTHGAGTVPTVTENLPRADRTTNARVGAIAPDEFHSKIQQRVLQRVYLPAPPASEQRHIAVDAPRQNRP